MIKIELLVEYKFQVSSMFISKAMVIGNFQNFPEYFRFLMMYLKCKSHSFFHEKSLIFFFKIRPNQSASCKIFILKLANIWNLWFFRKWSKLTFLTKKKKKKKHNSKSLWLNLMWFLIFISILHSPLIETFKNTKKSRKIVFLKLVTAWNTKYNWLMIHR